MNHHYNDITSRIGGAPVWWDEHAVPRYCEFSPDATANIYADEVVFMRIACQACGFEFRVAISGSMSERARYALVRAEGEGKVKEESFKHHMRYGSLAQGVLLDEIHYGDPPNNGCCGVGATMNSVPLEVLGFWTRRSLQWVRVEALEGPIDCEWARDEP